MSNGSDGNHWITIWGAALNESTGHYEFLYITDSAYNPKTLQRASLVYTQEGTLTTIKLYGSRNINVITTLSAQNKWFADKGTPPTLTCSLDQSNWFANRNKQTTIIHLSCTGTWRWDSLPDWVTLSSPSGLGNQSILITLAANTSGATRTAILKVTAPAPVNQAQALTIIQSPTTSPPPYSRA